VQLCFGKIQAELGLGRRVYTEGGEREGRRPRICTANLGFENSKLVGKVIRFGYLNNFAIQLEIIRIFQVDSLRLG